MGIGHRDRGVAFDVFFNPASPQSFHVMMEARKIGVEGFAPGQVEILCNKAFTTGGHRKWIVESHIVANLSGSQVIHNVLLAHASSIEWRHVS